MTNLKEITQYIYLYNESSYPQSCFSLFYFYYQGITLLLLQYIMFEKTKSEKETKLFAISHILLVYIISIIDH